MTHALWCMQAALSRRMLALLHTCTPQNLCNTLWAHAKVHRRDSHVSSST